MLRTIVRLVCLVAALSTAKAQAADNPWFGTWALQDAGDKPETLIYSDAGGGAMRMVSVEDKSIIVTRFDGKPTANTGAAASEGSALAVKSESRTRYRWTFYKMGKPFVSGINTLRPDGAAFEEVSWLVVKPSDKVTLVYEVGDQGAPGEDAAPRPIIGYSAHLSSTSKLPVD